MRRHILSNALVAVAIAAASSLGCDEEEANGRVALSSIIPEPVQVDLGLLTGTIVFDFSASPLDMSRKYDLEMTLYTGGFGVVLRDDATGVEFDAVSGTQVMTPPDDFGEYLVSASDDGATVTVKFYNYFQGATLNAGGDYSVTLTVLDSEYNDFFVVESFTRQVEVQ
jgi:hypothetical protein